MVLFLFFFESFKSIKKNFIGDKNDQADFCYVNEVTFESHLRMELFIKLDMSVRERKFQSHSPDL